jgi:hypothetical protein
LQDISRTIQEPWLMMGDFNEIASTDEKKGGAPVVFFLVGLMIVI